ncbi:TenA family transcriptional regulator [Agitococcus lubricus]|uniref:Pyrroloquinoline quinone (PQQ) biosynthesis protein C n=1 Tax=Agitococcus lubricus TaxID=1077255 RepID=A0A2T5IYX3_9GAMM|nr:iron-containing redox enzyme family protein [Agitococcus lubricus]PTQ89200.1 pyrroloquinoline quinone (PQQ) biosynthesis protein C [Agitococcus lubricus]
MKTHLEIVPLSGWSAEFWQTLTPLKNQIASHPLFVDMTAGHLSLKGFRHALLNFYPLIANFPAYMALNLAKTTHLQNNAIQATRTWLIHNIKTEERHLQWYRDWALSFGVSLHELEQVTPPPAMNAINHFLWHINQRGSVADSLAATNLAIEWATGEWSSQVFAGISTYAQQNISINPRTIAWLKAHAHYDDLHPYEAMELIRQLCLEDCLAQKSALNTAIEGMHYYLMALDDCYQSA